MQFPATPLFPPPFPDNIHVRCFLNTVSLGRILIPYIIDRGDSYGQDTSVGLKEPENPDAGRKTIVVEFSSPNLGKEFDGNHLRSTIIGAFIASLYRAMGWEVCKMNFLGDWGRHIGLLAVGWSRFGSEELLEADPLKHLLDVFTQISDVFKTEQEAAKKPAGEEEPPNDSRSIGVEKDEFFKRMEDGDADALALWRRFRDICVAKYTDLYARLNIHFDDYSGESEVSHESVEEVEAALRVKGVYEESDGACIINLKEHGGLGTPIARFSNGSTSYLLRDIAAVVERRKKYSFDKMIYVVTSKQGPHFQQVFKAVELMGYSDLDIHHINFGKFQGLSPKSDSSGLLLGDVLDQCQHAAQEFLQENPEAFPEFHDEDSAKVSDVLGGSALMTQELSVKRSHPFTFDVKKMIDLEGYTGIVLQYWLVKLGSKLKGVNVDREELEVVDYSMFEEDAYADVLRLLIQFPGVVKAAFKAHESSNLITLLFRVTDLLPAIWEDPDEPESSDQSLAKVAFFECIRQVLRNGIDILGLMPMDVSDSNPECDGLEG